MPSARDGPPLICAADLPPNRRPAPTAGRVTAAWVLAVSIRASDAKGIGLRRVSGEGQITGVAGGVAERFFDPEQLVEFGDAFASRRRAGLDLAAPDSPRQ